ncbi:unnamed protein product [Darwinula stevensoni]|uniref:DRBM domain-containing protein n=1 Tax=Darwinula stevensoni TaxID=69355 RepID=A0A7R9AFT4_9CRUS|nr:unnamed protein product [Darwinula stevensoni]CAG0902740.1 unnamed protein product [Darwinula stevensoni]
MDSPDLSRLRILKGIFKDGNTLVSMDTFLDKLSEKSLISVSQEVMLKKETYSKQIDETFYILFQKNPRPTYESVEKILIEMGREDIIAKLQDNSKNPVQALKEHCDKNGWKVEYFDVNESGPAHEKKYLMKVAVNTVYQPDEPSKSKKDAKAAAASLCLKNFGLM